MIDPIILDIGLEIVKAILGVAVPAMTIYLTIYTKKIGDKMERKARLENERREREELQNEINRQTAVAFTARSFELMDYDTRVEAIVENIKVYAMKNNLILHDHMNHCVKEALNNHQPNEKLKELTDIMNLLQK
jgi:hypothetical protein